MQGKRTKFKADFKAKVALEALKGDKSTAELAQIYGVHPTQVTQWKKQLLDQASSVFQVVKPRPRRSTSTTSTRRSASSRWRAIFSLAESA